MIIKMRFAYKLGLVILVVLLLTLAMPNVSAGGTSFSKSYNFTDYTNNKAYVGATNDTTTEVTAPDDYTALNSSNDDFQVYQTTKIDGAFAYTRFEFKVNESAGSINEINITWEGRGTADHGYAHYGYNLYVYNVTSGGWTQEKSYSTDNTKQTEYIVYTSGFSHLINSSGYLKILASSNYTASKNKWVDIETDYIDVNVTYFKIWNVSTDKLTYKNGETITTTWTSADGFGSGEDYINVEYWDVTAGTQFDLKSYNNTSATSSTSEALTSSEVGHEIAVYVYTTSSSTGDRSTAITPGDLWPYSILNPVYALITSCNSAGTEINEFAPGENVSVKAEGLEASTTYKIWIQNDPVKEGYTLTADNCTSCGGVVQGKEVPTDGSGNFAPELIWSIPSNASVTHHEYDIVVDNQVSGTAGTYNAANDGIDDADVAGIVAPVPDVPALVLFASGLMLVSVYFVYGGRRKEKGGNKGGAI